ncbi:MAG: 50S ribosomal protein L11 methyltransferase [bacterium]|nr:50S ribosomal protein L11 methyltransferase [bacterium]
MQRSKTYIGVSFRGALPLSEFIGEILLELGADGIEERSVGEAGELDLAVDYGIEEFGVAPPPPPAGPRELLCAFKEEQWGVVQPQLDRLVEAFLPVIPDLSYRWERLPKLNSVARWRADLKPYKLAPGIGVAPTKQHIPLHDKNRWFIIPPKMAFGTGEHATTRIASQLTAEWTKRGDKVLDAGCGTGILGFVALAKGAKSVLGIEIEADAVREARQNIKRNKFTSRMTVQKASILQAELPDHSFDLILANIHLNVLKAWWQDIPRLLKPGGRVIVTGLLVGQGRKLGRALGPAATRRVYHSWIVLGFKG